MAHTLIIGQSGMGKTTLLQEKILTDISNGKGVFYIDPNGSDDLLKYIPKNRKKDVILFDPSDYKNPIAWNPLQSSGHIALITSAIERGIKDAAGYSNTSTPTMSLYIRNCLYALIEANQPLLGMPLLLVSEVYRERVLKKVSDPLVKMFWQEFEKLPGKERRQDISSTYNKAYSLILDTRLRYIFGQTESAFQMSDVLKGKIFIARLPQGELGIEQVQLLGHLLLAQFHLSALSQPGEVSLYIDDVHLFDGGTLCEMLASILDFGVSITLAHQFLDQLSPKFKASILANTAEKYVFKVSMKDSKELNEYLREDNTRKKLYELPLYQARKFPFSQRDMFNEGSEPLEDDWPVDEAVPGYILNNMHCNYARRETLVSKEVNGLIKDT